jgi:hypothetical protein
MVEGKTYLVRVRLQDQEHNEIFLTENVEFSHHFDKSILTVLDRNLIGSELIVRVEARSRHDVPTPAHKTILAVALKQIKARKGENYQHDSNRLKEEREITITGPLMIVHPTPSILLPYI